MAKDDVYCNCLECARVHPEGFGQLVTPWQRVKHRRLNTSQASFSTAIPAKRPRIRSTSQISNRDSSDIGLQSFAGNNATDDMDDPDDDLILAFQFNLSNDGNEPSREEQAPFEMLPRDTEDDELDRAVDDITLPAVHTFDTLASYGRPTPALLARLQNLPPVVTSFVHHELAASDRETYTLAALLSLKGIAHNDISNVLAFAQGIRMRLTAGSVSTPTPSRESCCHYVPLGARCRGRMFRLEGERKRPFRILAFTPPSVLLQIYLRDPTFVKALQEWRQASPVSDAIGVNDLQPIEMEDDSTRIMH
ncbi:MAG: hypothetical protein TREMPRED_000172, partial [Tremellales sp. Tagirdzhanova-0007]